MPTLPRRLPLLYAFAAALTLSAASAPAAPPTPYDPLAVSTPQAASEFDPHVHDFTVHDAERTRDIPVRVYLPAGPDQATEPAPVILFSHGLGGARTNSPYLGEHWSARGYAVVCLQHPGSDESIWRDVEPHQRMAATKDAATVDNLRQRLADVTAVLDQLERGNVGDPSPTPSDLARRLDLNHIGMSGHSFGALTTQYVSGQTALRGKQAAVDPRIDAAVLMSPGPPRLGSVAKAFANVRIPWLLMTGTRDEAPVGRTTAADRRKIFPALPPGHKYELVLHEAEHHAFGDGVLPGEDLPRNPNHHRVILALSTAFWDAYLRDDADAKAWLDGDGPQTVLEREDQWQLK